MVGAIEDNGTKTATEINAKTQGQITRLAISKGAHLHLTIREYNSKNNAWQHVNPQKYVKY